MSSNAFRLLPLLVCACQTEPPAIPPTDEAFRTMTVAIGEQVREVTFVEVRCSPVDANGVETIELFSDLETKVGTPRVLIARLRGDEVVDAHAFVPQVKVDEFEYDMLQIVAAEVDGSPKPDCRVERGDDLVIVCNEATVLPWLSPGERPRPSFKATVSCPTPEPQ